MELQFRTEFVQADLTKRMSHLYWMRLRAAGSKAMVAIQSSTVRIWSMAARTWSSMTASGPAAGGGRAPMNRAAHRWPKAASVGTSACRPYSLASWSLVRASHMPWSASRMRETLATGSVGTAPEHDELDRRHVSHGSGEEQRRLPDVGRRGILTSHLTLFDTHSRRHAAQV
jgi:hypothetical protein